MSLATVETDSIASTPPRRPRPRRSGRRHLDLPTRLVLCLVVGLLALMIVYPLVRIFGNAFTPEGSKVLSGLLSNPVNRTIVLNTLVMGVLVGALGTLIGFALAYVQTRLAFRGKRLLHLIALMPIVSPPFAVATAVITLFGRRGLVTDGLFQVQTDIYGLPGLTLVLVLSFFPVAYMNFKGLLESLDPSLDEAAANLGGGKWRIFWTVTVPMLVPGFASSFLLLFVEAIADLANPLVIGGDYTVLASRAFIAITGEYDVRAGSAYSLALLLPAVLVFLVQRYWVGRRSVVTVTGKPTGKPITTATGPGRVGLLALAGFIAAVIVLIYATVIGGAFVRILGVNNDFTLDHFSYVLSGIGNQSITDTTLLALIATPIAGLLGMVTAWLVVRRLRRGAAWLDFLGMLGLAVPGTVVGIGYAIAFNQPLIWGGRMWLPALGGGAALFGGAIAIVMVYVIRSMPSGQRSGIAALQQIDPSIDEASASLGADSVTTFRRVTLPLIRPALLSGLIYAFARSMTTLSPIIFITTPQTQIMTKQILSEVDAGRFGNAFAFCTLLILIVATVMGLLNLALRRRPAPTSGLGSGL